MRDTALNIGYVLLCGRWRTWRSWRTSLLCTWSVGAGYPFCRVRQSAIANAVCETRSQPSAWKFHRPKANKLSIQTVWLLASDIRIGPRWQICIKLRLYLSLQNALPLSNPYNALAYALCPLPTIQKEQTNEGADSTPRKVAFCFERKAMH